MSLAILFHFLCAQHVSDINVSIIRSLRLFCWITTLVVLFLVWCVLEFQCGWVWVVSMLQASACNTDTTPTQPHRIANTNRTKNKTTNVVVQQNSHKLLMMDILMSETCWAHKKWNKIASDVKLVFYYLYEDCWYLRGCGSCSLIKRCQLCGGTCRPCVPGSTVSCMAPLSSGPLPPVGLFIVFCSTNL